MSSKKFQTILPENDIVKIKMVVLDPMCCHCRDMHKKIILKNKKEKETFYQKHKIYILRGPNDPLAWATETEFPHTFEYIAKSPMSLKHYTGINYVETN